MEAWFFVIAGLALLGVGGEALIRGASGIALLARLTPAVIGLTIVAAGTSMPEMVVSVQAAHAGSAGLAVGNVVGSNIFNIGLILGLTALAAPLVISGNTVRLEWPVMMLSALQLHLLSRDGFIDQFEGGFLLAAMFAFFGYAVFVGRKGTTASEQQAYEGLTTASFGRTGLTAWVLNAVAVALGVALLAVGSTLLVQGAVSIAQAMGVSETIIGLTIVAAGTSSPELVASLVAALRGKNDIAVANVIGSNIINVLGILGVASLVAPLPVPSEIPARDNWWMLGVSLLLFPLMARTMRITRVEGGLLLAVFLAYLTVLIRSIPQG